MAHFAKVENGVVTDVIVADNAQWCGDNLGGTWVQTSYNTRGGVHYGSDGEPDGGVALYKNYAGLEYNFDGIGFFAPQPYPSWILDPETYYWEAPVPYPNDGKNYVWDEATLSWVEVQP
jgi:hypothetical protein